MYVIHYKHCFYNLLSWSITKKASFLHLGRKKYDGSFYTGQRRKDVGINKCHWHVLRVEEFVLGCQWVEIWGVCYTNFLSNNPFNGQMHGSHPFMSLSLVSSVIKPKLFDCHIYWFWISHHIGCGSEQASFFF